MRKTPLQKYGSFEQFTKSIRPFNKPVPGSVKVLIPAGIIKGTKRSIIMPEKTVGYSVKITGSVKQRFCALVTAGFSADSLIRITCEIHEQWLADRRQKLESGKMKKEFKNLTQVK